ncbi:Protein kinase domain-containing protein [Forsythia ovata]|uniref:non-specific serine/threonine protein kinase n=1 Tax=Forsythia ovata TaxID=205694 RepID=A0ABD1T8D0_9LAMI
MIDVPPLSRALKRVLLICLRCIDLDANKRPKMGQTVHMLEADEFPYRRELRSTRETAPLHPRAARNNKVLLSPEDAQIKDRGAFAPRRIQQKCIQDKLKRRYRQLKELDLNRGIEKEVSLLYLFFIPYGAIVKYIISGDAASPFIIALPEPLVRGVSSGPLLFGDSQLKICNSATVMVIGLKLIWIILQ